MITAVGHELALSTSFAAVGHRFALSNSSGAFRFQLLRFSGCSAPHLHGGIVTFLIIHMGEHYSLRGETFVFLVIYMGELSWTVLGRSWVGLARPWAETSANHHVNGSKHLHGGMLLARSLVVFKRS